MSRRHVLVRALYYGVVGGLLLAVVVDPPGGAPSLLPHWFEEMSEGLLLALLLPGWVQGVRPRLEGTRAEWPVTAAAAAGCLVVGLVLFSRYQWWGDLQTLHETFLALAVLLPYVQARRPLARAAVLALPAAALLVSALGVLVPTVHDLAEGLALLVLVPLGLDLVDRAVLEPGAATSARRRAGWYAGLLGAPVLLAALAVLVGADGESALGLAGRVQEPFLGVLAVQLFLTAARGQRPPEPAGSPVRVGSARASG